jgi:hypothetical protein
VKIDVVERTVSAGSIRTMTDAGDAGFGLLAVAIHARYRAGRRPDARLKAETMETAFDRYFVMTSLMGTPATRRPIALHAAELGVTDLCCLIDFGPASRPGPRSLALLTGWKASIQRR